MKLVGGVHTGFVGGSVGLYGQLGGIHGGSASTGPASTSELATAIPPMTAKTLLIFIIVPGALSVRHVRAALQVP